jgi:glycosyltransferase involved in cell wall biosynthesis
MKIVQILPKFDTGGAEKFCVDISNALSKSDSNEVHLIVLGEIEESEILAKQVDTKRVKLISLNKRGKSIKVIYDIYKKLKEIGPDISHTHLRAQAYSALPLILTKTPNIHTIHNLAQKEITKKYRKLYKFLYKRFNFTPVAISDEVLESVKHEYGEEFDIKIDNGANALTKSDNFKETKEFFDNLREGKNGKIFVSVGRVTRQKNFLMMIDVFEELVQEGYDVKVVIIGSQTNDKEYAKLCRERLRDKEHIIFVGEKSNVGDYLINCDAFCLSSIYEGMPISILEAMSVGKATVSTPVGGVVDLIEEGVNGYLSRDTSKESYKEAIKKFIENEPLDSKKIKSIFEEKYSIDKCAKEYQELYKKRL